METKTCRTCKTVKPESEFRKRHLICKKCTAIQTRQYLRNNPEKYEKVLAKQREDYKKRGGNKPFHRNTWLKRTYGIDLDTYNQMLKDQGGVCYICSKPETRAKSKYLVVDHCHQTGKVRGLLCAKCNTLIGYAGDSVEHLNKAVEYLLKFSTTNAE